MTAFGGCCCGDSSLSFSSWLFPVLLIYDGAVAAAVDATVTPEYGAVASSR